MASYAPVPIYCSQLPIPNHAADQLITSDALTVGDVSRAGPAHRGMKELSDVENRKVINNFKHSRRKCEGKEDKLGHETLLRALKELSETHGVNQRRMKPIVGPHRL